MSDNGLRLTPRQIFILRAARLNCDDSCRASINPPYFHPDRGDCKILEMNMLLTQDDFPKLYNGWRITGLGKDLVNRIDKLDQDWMDELSKGHVGSDDPYR